MLTKLSSIFIFFFIFTAIVSVSKADRVEVNGLYVNTFGNQTNQALLFIHGGPGYNSYDFEVTTAQKLSDHGFFVVVYDQRGQGRSSNADVSAFTYKQYADDIKSIIDQLHLVRPILLGHSHGGPIAIKFESYYPNIVEKIILISAPIRFEINMRILLDHSSNFFLQKGDNQSFNMIAYADFELFSDKSPDFDNLSWSVGYAFDRALNAGLYSPKVHTANAVALFDILKSNPLKAISDQKPLANPSVSTRSFIKNENYFLLDQSDFVNMNRTHFCGIYGEEDGLFSPLELRVINHLLQDPNEPNRFVILSGASHAVYIDQQQDFFNALKNTCGLNLN